MIDAGDIAGNVQRLELSVCFIASGRKKADRIWDRKPPAWQPRHGSALVSRLSHRKTCTASSAICSALALLLHRVLVTDMDTKKFHLR